MKKKLLVITDTQVGNTGGAEQHLELFIHHIDDAAFDVDVIQLLPNGHKLLHIEKTAKAHLYHFPLDKLNSLDGLRQTLRIVKHVRAKRYDVCISFFEKADIINALLFPFAGIKHRISSRRDTGFKNSDRIKMVYRYINKSFCRTFAPSKAVFDSIAEQGYSKQNIRLIYNGVDSNTFACNGASSVRQELGISDDAFVMTMVASLFEVKNHSTVLNSVKMLRDANVPAHLLLAGKGHLLDTLKEQAQKLEIDAYVHFLGRRNDVQNILTGSDLFVLASHTEGLSNALLEAMATGLPAIASNVGGNPEVVIDKVTGFLVEPTDTNAYYEHAKALFESKPLRQQMGQAAVVRIQDTFTVRAMMDAYKSELLAVSQ